MSPKNAKPDPIEETAIELAKPQKAMKEKNTRAKKQKELPVELPLLVEIGFSLSGIFLMLVDALVAYISFVSGASWIDIFMRVVVSTVTVGFVLWLLSMNLSNGSLAAALKHMEEEEKEQKKKEQELLDTHGANSSAEQLGVEA